MEQLDLFPLSPLNEIESRVKSAVERFSKKYSEVNGSPQSIKPKTEKEYDNGNTKNNKRQKNQKPF